MCLNAKHFPEKQFVRNAEIPTFVEAVFEKHDRQHKLNYISMINIRT